MLKRAGFDLKEIDKIDIKDINYLVEEQRKYETVKRYLDVLDSADSFLIAGTAIHAPKGKGHRAYRRWHKKIERRIKKEYGILNERSTLWDKIDKTRKNKKSITLN